MSKTIVLCVITIVTYSAGHFSLVEASGKFEKVFCDPAKTDSAIVAKVVKCNTNFKTSGTAERKALGEKVDKILHDKCLGKAGDMSKFKKVDLTKADLKTMLIEVCDDGYLKCHDALMDSDKKVHDDLDKIDHLTDSKEYKKLEKCDYAAIKK